LDRLPILVLDVERQAFLRPVGPDEMRRESLDALVVRAREIADAGTLDLDDARTEIGEVPRENGATIACSSVTTMMPSSGRIVVQRA
jgi:hypothetical protein